MWFEIGVFSFRNSAITFSNPLCSLSDTLLIALISTGNLSPSRVEIPVKNVKISFASVEEIYQLILETVQTEKDMIRIAGEYYPAGFVKGKLLKLNYSHIEYVLECMDKNTTKVRNIKQYLLAALFNAPSTIGSYYKAAVNHDMPQYAN